MMITRKNNIAIRIQLKMYIFNLIVITLKKPIHNSQKCWLTLCRIDIRLGSEFLLILRAELRIYLSFLTFVMQ